MNTSKIKISSQDISQRRHKLVRRAQQLPPAGARPVTVSGLVAGWIGPAAIETIAEIPGVAVEDEAVHIRHVPRLRYSIDRVMALVADYLNNAGCIRSWRNELLDVIAEGKTISRIERGAVRPLGLLTQAVHLNAWTADGKLWVARRSLAKSTDPGLWDTLSGGIVSAGEDLQTAMLRETYEEAGLNAVALSGHSPLRTVLRMYRRLDDGYQVENVLLSDCVLAPGTVPSNLDGEVMRFQSLDLDSLWEMMLSGVFTLEAELSILDSLQQRLNLT